MSCRHVQELLADYSVGILEAREHREVETHLASCAACREELRIMDAAVALVERHGVRQPPPGLFNAVRNRIEAGDVRQERPAWWWLWLNSTPARVSGMTVAVAAVAAGFLMPVQTPEVPSIPVHVSAGVGSVANNDLGNSIRQHAMAHMEGPLADRVAWEAMAQLVTTGEDARLKRPGVE